MSRLAGHELYHEGAAYAADGRLVNLFRSGSGGIGRGKCSCGALSAVYDSGNLRKKWHREHKETIRNRVEEEAMSTMAELLVDHQRHNAGSCLCGYSIIGRSHPEHVAEELAKAGYGKLADAWEASRHAVWYFLDRRAQGRNESPTPNPYRSQS